MWPSSVVPFTCEQWCKVIWAGSLKAVFWLPQSLYWPIYWPTNRSHSDCSSCCSCPSCCGDCTVAIVNTVAAFCRIQLSVNTPYQHTFFIHAQSWVTELWLVLCIYCMHCACMLANVLCSYACCVLTWSTTPMPGDAQTQQAWFLRDCRGCGRHKLCPWHRGGQRGEKVNIIVIIYILDLPTMMSGEEAIQCYCPHIK